MRPVVPTQPTDSPEEAFQNTTLRPILKQHHDLLSAILRHYLVKRKVHPEQVPAAKRLAKVKELVTRDNRLRGLLFGVVVGHFTAAELEIYLEKEGEINRRITNLLVERLQSSLS